MRERTIEIKVAKRQFCYGEEKVRLKELKEFNCPWGYEKYEEVCINCRFYSEKIFSSKITGEMKDIKEVK